MKVKSWKSIHSYIGLIAAVLLVGWGTTGFLMVNPNRLGLKHAEVRFTPLLAWYRSMATGSGKERRPKIEYITLYTEKGEPVEVASHRGQVLLRSPGEEGWLMADNSEEWSGLIRTEHEALVLKRKPRTERGKEFERLTWGRVLDDLHTGQFFAGRLSLLYQAGTLCLVTLTLSGLWLWYVPWRSKRRRSFVRVAVPKATKMRVNEGAVPLIAMREDAPDQVS